MRRFLLQMAGESGAGKSTLALAVGRATGAVVIDRDHVKAPLLHGGLADHQAGGLAFDVFFPLAESLLGQSFSVVLDSGAFWQGVLDRGRALADRSSVDYRLVRCICGDVSEQERRLRSRERLISQPSSRTELAISMARPGVILTLAEPHLDVDTTQPLEDCVERVLEYLRS